jgi:hypothetical protein
VREAVRRTFHREGAALAAPFFFLPAPPTARKFGFLTRMILGYRSQKSSSTLEFLWLPEKAEVT